MDLCESSLDKRQKAGFVLFLTLPIIILGLYHIVDKGYRAFFRIDSGKLRKYSGVILRAVVEQMFYEGQFIVKPYLKVLG